MEYDEDLKKLESNVERMLSSLDSAQSEKKSLLADIVRLSEEKKELEEQVKRLKDEKKSIHQRVTGLLGSIEKWEKASLVEADALSEEDTLDKGPSAFAQGVQTGN